MHKPGFTEGYMAGVAYHPTPCPDCAKLRAEVELLQAKVYELVDKPPVLALTPDESLTALQTVISAKSAEVERLRAALGKVLEWAEAPPYETQYPQFHADIAEARAALEAQDG